ncbi:hypothetical protein [Mycetocola tolaasinivorans]|uniref:hypothetical protein n=1 Tax=Mycetocola tolaasinivorans TaxID=76635 RepID=UPI000EF47F1A|nr:hypothetical protein [Mycetocola tolaasinivorans]
MRRARCIRCSRGHLDEALAEDASTETVRRVLADLGAPADIAATATPAPVAVVIDGPPASDRFALWAVVAACASIAMILISTLVALLLALITLVASIVHLRAPGANRRLTWLANVIAGLLLVVAIATVILRMVISVGIENVDMTPHFFGS